MKNIREADVNSAKEELVWNIVTVTYNSAEILRRHWANLALPAGCQWTVVDNASSDGSAKVARGLGATVIQLEKNVGFGAANNVGACSAKSHFVAFANPDVIISTTSLARFTEILEKDSDVLIAPQLVNPDGSLQASGRGLPTLGAKMLNRLRPQIGTHYRLFASSGEMKYVSWVMGAALAMTSSFFVKLQWDERFFVYYEDSDIGLRAWKSGGRVILDGNSNWRHSWARETSGLNFHAWKLELTSMWKFYIRYPHLLFPAVLAQFCHPERKLIGKSVDPNLLEIWNAR